MTDSTNQIAEQLRALGHAVEDRTAATTAQQILDAPAAIDVDRLPSPGPERDRKPPRRLVSIIAAAVVALAAIASYTLFVRADPTPDLELAAAAHPLEPTGPEDDNGWEALRQCESSGDYTVDSGNTFYGAYQFTRETWRDTARQVGLSSVASANPAKASPPIQDALAGALYDEAGADPWPVCGRFVTGPMITPLVPQWLGELSDAQRGIEVIVFLAPDATPGQQEGVEQYLGGILGPSYDSLVTFVDKETAYAEFQTMFADEEQLRDAVSVVDMPPSYRVSSTLSPIVFDTIADLAGVFEVVYNDRFDRAPPPRRLSIPSLSVETPVFTDPSATALGAGAGVINESERGLAVAGYGSFDGAVFSGLSTLQPGDIVQVSELVDDQHGSYEILHTYEVVAPPETIAVDDIQPFDDSTALVGLTLVADVPDEPSMRTVVRLLLAAPDRASYGLGEY